MSSKRELLVAFSSPTVRTFLVFASALSGVARARLEARVLPLNQNYLARIVRGNKSDVRVLSSGRGCHFFDLKLLGESRGELDAERICELLWDA